MHTYRIQLNIKGTTVYVDIKAGNSGNAIAACKAMYPAGVQVSTPQRID